MNYWELIDEMIPRRTSSKTFMPVIDHDYNCEQNIDFELCILLRKNEQAACPSSVYMSGVCLGAGVMITRCFNPTSGPHGLL